MYSFQKKVVKVYTKSKIARIFVPYFEKRLSNVLESIPDTGTIMDKQRERRKTRAQSPVPKNAYFFILNRRHRLL